MLDVNPFVVWMLSQHVSSVSRDKLNYAFFILVIERATKRVEGSQSRNCHLAVAEVTI